MLKEYFQIGAWIVGILVGALAFYKGILELRLSRNLRERELKWNQAKMAKEMLSEFESNPKYQRACQMLDWKSYEYTLDSSKQVTIKRKQVLDALRVTNLKFTNQEKYIRESFIELFNCFEWLEHFIDRDLISIDDISPVLEYRVISIISDQEIYLEFLKKYEYKEALLFLERFPDWRV